MPREDDGKNGADSEMRPLITNLTMLLVAAVLLVFVRNEIAVAVLVGVIGTTLVTLGEELIRERPRLAYLWRSARHWNSTVRISASYLFRIKIDDEYLLIRGDRFPDQYQPVGGVYKMLPEGRSLLSSLHVLDDDLLPVDETSRDDLRIRIKGRHLWTFMRWYDSGQGRETDTWREFSEELIRPGILSFSTFPHIRAVRSGRHQEFRFSDYAQSTELLIADIFRLLLSPEQEVELRRLAEANEADRVRFATEDEIRRLGFAPKKTQEFRVSPTAVWTL
jgi:hypothetical protein